MNRDLQKGELLQDMDGKWWMVTGKPGFWKLMPISEGAVDTYKQLIKGLTEEVIKQAMERSGK